MRTTVRAKKSECSGCGACVSICPKGAISMKPDDEGFLYPAVDGALCVNCDLCEKRCPAGKPTPENQPAVLGAQHRDLSVRAASSSGGVFTALARSMFAKGGVVFGAAFDENLRVEHIGAFDESELAAMRGSKYVQSDAADAVGNAAQLLARGLPVLFSGTPCQVAGLRAKLNGKNEEQLLTVDFVCHGVPSPGIFASYLKELEAQRGQRVVAYSFRDKRKGWKDFYAVATFEDGSEHTGSQIDEPFLYGFLQNLYLRPSCMKCTEYRVNHHPADITIADMWGVERVCPERDDDTGLSLVFVNTEKGRKAIEACAGEITTFPVSELAPLYKANGCCEKTAKAHEKRWLFFRRFKKSGFSGEYTMKLLAPPSKAEKIVRRIAHLPFGAVRRLRVLLGRGK
ncbi:MAG: Coenzyme F420 hydrogenase/dehydrogenase, beta subunit C-terminal domain [Clostridia bacterium]|nr:Coenzyme F420 hydrogenase/dehydrogenase, beta subunit C-terminal domain [Clostridia bacterium]